MSPEKSSQNGPAASPRRTAAPWWEQRSTAIALILLSAVPLLYPPIPPLVDLFGHMGRYRVELDLATSPWLHNYFGFHWAAIGNLGVDILVIPLSKVFGLELAVKLIILAIPPLTVAGFLWVAREVHGRIPPTALFALPFAYSHPFLYGFVNFALSIAFAFLAFGLWLRLARLDRLRLRAILFVPISLIVFFAHTFGWGVLGLLCFSAEAVRQHDAGKRWLRAGANAVLHASVMALPLLIMIVWRSEAHGGMTLGWFEWSRKLDWLEDALRDRWEEFDLAGLGVVGLVLLFAVVSRRLTFSRNLFFSALVLLIGFVVIPRTVFGSTFADMRLIPYVLAVAILAIRFKNGGQAGLAHGLAGLGLAFFLLRIGGHTASFAIAADDQRSKLEALRYVPMGAPVASMVVYERCGTAWALPRNSHLGAMVIVRRQGFSNDQWVIEGLNLLELRYRQAGLFKADSSQIVSAMDCPSGKRSWRIDRALRSLPRDKFDYLWLIDVPDPDPRLVAGMSPVWRGGGSILYRVHP